jgi:hypothetical protein
VGEALARREAVEVAESVDRHCYPDSTPAASRDMSPEWGILGERIPAP